MVIGIALVTAIHIGHEMEPCPQPYKPIHVEEPWASSSQVNRNLDLVEAAFNKLRLCMAQKIGVLERIISTIPGVTVPGLPGSTGLDGPPGEDGDAGADGIDGAPGEDGDPGIDGDAGPPGEDGDDGLRGFSGAPGLDGEDGLRGFDGMRGLPGDDGIPGLPGAPGISGIDGTPGRGGSPGLDGDDGTIGNPGMRGLTGDDGDPGVKGQSVPGIDGDDGVAGLAGIRGLAGDDGTPGIDGSPGLQGDEGDEGDPGAPGNDGANGTNGTNGSTGATGANGKSIWAMPYATPVSELADGDGWSLSAAIDDHRTDTDPRILSYFTGISGTQIRLAVYPASMAVDSGVWVWTFTVWLNGSALSSTDVTIRSDDTPFVVQTSLLSAGVADGNSIELRVYGSQISGTSTSGGLDARAVITVST